MSEDLRDQVVQLHVTVFGLEGTGGLAREVEVIKIRVTDVEKRLNTLSVKWLILTGLAGLLGQALGSTVMKAFTLHFLQ